MGKLTSATMVPLGVVVACCLSLIATAYKLSAEIVYLRLTIENVWTISDMDRWEAEVKLLNPSARFPDAHMIAQRRKQNTGNVN